MLNTMKRPRGRHGVNAGAMRAPTRGTTAVAIAAAARAGDNGAVTHRSLERGLAVLEAVAAAGRPVALAETARRARPASQHRAPPDAGAGRAPATCCRTSARATTSSRPSSTRSPAGCGTPSSSARSPQPLLEELTRPPAKARAWRPGSTARSRSPPSSETDGPVRVVQDVAAHRPVYCTAVGKALAAWLPARRGRRRARPA